MQAEIFDIVARNKADPFDIVAATDFGLSFCESIDAGVILERNDLSLYCLDPVERQALFVLTPEPVTAGWAPFLYIPQYDDARQVFKISYETMERLADRVALDDRRLLLVYSTGRCGSTLMSSVFDRIDGAVSLSEPDVFTQLVQLLDFAGSNRDEIGRLARASILLTCKAFTGADQPWWVIKFRSFVIELADMLDEHFPRATNLFMYRNALTWANSFVRAFGGDQMPTAEQFSEFGKWLVYLSPMAEAYQRLGAELSSGPVLLSLAWLDCMERCLERLQAGQRLLPIRYEDLRRQPTAMLEQIFDYCNIAVDDLATLQQVLQKDSQSNTPLARRKTTQSPQLLDAETTARISRLIGARPVVNRADYVLPGTLRID